MFDKRDLEILEKLCQEQLDHWNHKGVYALESDYVWFTYKGARIVDPWQKEKYQVFGCDWPDHTNKEMCTDDPFTYYGRKNVEALFERICRMRGIEYSAQRIMRENTKEPDQIDTESWYYESGKEGYDLYRYILGEKGKRPLIVFGINPSIAVPGEENLDPTMKIVRGIVEDSSEYDGYVMMNIYPQRATNPEDIHYEPVEKAIRKNLELIEKYLDLLTKEFGPLDIWAAWGGNIEKRKYLMDNLRSIYDISQRFPVRWVQKGNFKHPHHPLYLSKKHKFIEFDIEEYLNR